MKVFAKVLAILAVLLILASLFALVIFTIFQVPLATLIEIGSSAAIRNLNKYPVILGGTILSMVLQLLFTVPMVFLAGRKKGGIWIEIVLVLLMVLTIPTTKMAGDFLSWFFFDKIYLRSSALDPFWCFNYYYQRFGLQAIYTRYYAQGIVKVWMEWLCAPAEVSQVLLFIVCGISVGLRRKKKKARKLAEIPAADAESISE